MRHTWLSSPRSRGGIPLLFFDQSCSHCVLLSALPYAPSPTPLAHTPHIHHTPLPPLHHTHRYQIELLFVLCTILTGRRKIDIQRMLAELDTAAVLQKLSARMSWDAETVDIPNPLQVRHSLSIVNI